MNAKLRAAAGLVLLLAVSAPAATENFTLWQETDPGYLTVSSASVVAAGVLRNDTCYVAKDFGADYWDDDFEVRFTFLTGAVSHTDTSSFLGLCAFTTVQTDWYNVSKGGGAGVTPVYSRDTTGYKLFLWMVKPSSEWFAFSENIYVSTGTTYYITFGRDYDGGTYEKGLYTLSVCTGNYYGESGASLVGSKTLDAPTDATQDFRYILTGLSKLNGGGQTASGTVSNLDLAVSGPSEDPPAKVSGAYPPDDSNNVSLSATLSWSPAAGAETYDLYFGESPLNTQQDYIGNQAGTTYDADLEWETNYQWRVDAKNAYGTTEGDLWNFSTVAEAGEPAGVEDFTSGAWIEIDPGSDIAITDADTITVTALPSNLSAYVYKDFGSAFFGGDLLLRERITVTASGNLGFFGALALANSPKDYQNMLWADDDGILVYWRYVGGVQTLYLNVLVNGDPYTDSMTGTLSTEYFLTLSRDDDGGTYGSGLVTLRVCTTAYYGAAGAELVDTLQVNVPAGGATDFSHAMVAQSMTNQGSNTVSGTITHLEAGAPTEPGGGEEPEPDPEETPDEGVPGPTGHGPYYVSPLGSNDADGCTQETPWRTLAYALDTGVTHATESYNVIYLMAGNHGGIGLSTKTWDTTDWDDEWLIEGMTGAELTSLGISGVEAFLDFNDLTFRRPNPDGSTVVTISNSQSVKLRNSRIYGNDGPTRAELTDRGIWIVGQTGTGYCQDITIDGVELWDMNRAIHIHQDVRDDIVIQNCVGHRLNEDFFYLGEFASTRGSYDPIKLYYNKYVDHPDTNKPFWDGEKWQYPHGTGLSFRGDNVHVRGHVAVAISGSGATRFYESYGPYNNVTIEDSIFFSPGGIYGTDDAGYARNAGFYQIGTGCKIVNNTFIAGITQGYPFAARRYAGNVVIQPHEDYDDSLIFKNNIVVAFVDMGGMTVDGGNNMIYSLWQNGAWASTWDDNDVIVCTGASTIRSGYTVDWFEQVGNVFIGSDTFSKWWTDHVLPTTYWDFALPSTSSAVDAGQPSADSGYDVRGLARDASPDIGAFEYIAASAPLKATNPTPAHAATNVPLSTVLQWSGVADNWDVYIGTAPTALVKQANVQGRDYQYSWAYATTYYWRIDAHNATGVTTGDVWRFTTVAQTVDLPAKVASPYPVDGAVNVGTTTTLSWGQAARALAYNVYLGTVDLALLTSTAGLSAPVSLGYDTLYMWRVDSVGASGTTTGDVWSFRTVVESGTPDEPGPPEPSSVGVHVRPPAGRYVRPDGNSARYTMPVEGLSYVDVNPPHPLPATYRTDTALSGYLQRIVIVAQGTDTQWSLTVLDEWGAPLFEANDLDMTEGLVAYDYDGNLAFANGLTVIIEDTDEATASLLRVRLYVRETWREAR